MTAYNHDTIEHNGRTFRVEYHFDEHKGTPWDEHDEHGPVSEWTTRDKRSGEFVLSSDRGTRRYYDFAKACKIARRDGWSYLPGKMETKQIDATTWQAKTPGFVVLGDTLNAAIGNLYAAYRASMTPRQYAAAAALSDFEYLRRWCANQWHWCGLVVTMLDADGIPVLGADASLWGLESDARDYLAETTLELADEALTAFQALPADA